MGENKVCWRLNVCGTNAAGFCLRSAVLSSPWLQGRNCQRLFRPLLGADLQKWFYSKHVSLATGQDLGVGRSSFSALQNCRWVVEPPGVGRSGRRSIVWPWWGAECQDRLRAALLQHQSPFMERNSHGQVRHYRSFSELLVSSLLIIMINHQAGTRQRNLSVQVTTDLETTPACQDVELL